MSFYKRWWFWLVVVIILFYFIIGFGFLNPTLNRVVSGEVDKSCSVDSDCELKSTTCGPCDCGDAVNKEWDKFCLFSNGFRDVQVMCKICPSPGLNFDVRCVENQCERVWKLG